MLPRSQWRPRPPRTILSRRSRKYTGNPNDTHIVLRARVTPTLRVPTLARSGHRPTPAALHQRLRRRPSFGMNSMLFRKPGVTGYTDAGEPIRGWCIETGKKRVLTPY
jgi:hypothetical protein